MAQVVRQSNLLAAEDWRVIYRAFTEVNFNSYDFDTIRSAMVTYMQQNFPEDFNDYIQSSEFIALIDLLAYLGQSLAFRMDLNSRENFIDTAERRESLLRLARLVSYKPNRNRAANGLVKVVSIATDEDIEDSDGNDLSNQTVFWNDANNPDWFEQFNLIMNSAFINTNPFGQPVKEGTVGGIPTQLYQFNNLGGTGPVQGFTTLASGVSANFEFVNTNFEDNGNFFERSPDPLASFHTVYRADGNGNASPDTGFFFQFKQGSLQNQDFQLDVPIENRTLDINVENINNNDVFVQEITDAGDILQTWREVPAVAGNNVIFNDLNRDVRDIYNVVTRQNDQITIRFADGRFGSIPTGIFRIWYRTSIGQRLRVRPRDFGDQTISIPYTNDAGQEFTLTLTVRLQNIVDNSSPAESDEQIRNRAPQVYYTQNRMVNGQDYNVFPLTNSQALKVKAVNRTYSGHSRYVDINDPTGARQDLKVFSDDGILYRDSETFGEAEQALPTALSAIEIFNSKIFPLLQEVEFANFYYEFFPKAIDDELSDNILQPKQNVDLTVEPPVPTSGKPWVTWEASSLSIYSSTGRFRLGSNFPLEAQIGGSPLNAAVQVGRGTGGSIADYLTEGALVHFWKAGWVSVQQVRGFGDLIESNGQGNITLDERVQTNDVILEVIPPFRNTLNSTERDAVINEIEEERSFGLRYDYTTQEWKIVEAANLAPYTGANAEPFSLDNAGDTSLTATDSSWLFRAEYKADSWRFITRNLTYIFESARDVRFFFLNKYRIIDNDTGLLARDTVKVFKTNSKPGSNDPLGVDYVWKLSDTVLEEDGFIEPRRVKITFLDSDFDGIPDNPKAFREIVLDGNDNLDPDEYVFQQKYTDINDLQRWRPAPDVFAFTNDPSSDPDTQVPDNSDGSILYNVFNGKFYQNETGTNTPNFSELTELTNNNYRAFVGRNMLNFQWKHFAPRDQRIDPAITNIIDIFVLEQNYDNSIREWIDNNRPINEKPPAPTSEQLRLTFGDIEEFKMVSDEIIWRPVEYKVLFGRQAPEELQATLKVVKIEGTDLSDSEIKSQIVQIIDEFFDPQNWDFGETFYFTELAAFIHSRLPTTVASIVLVPVNEQSKFGRLFEVSSLSNEIFISSATVNDIQIIDNNTQANLRIGR
jgi:hypothetical protein